MSDSDNPSLSLEDLILKVLRKQYPDTHITMLYRWGKEVRVNGRTAGCIINNRWETWHWERDEDKIDLDKRFGHYKIISDKRITEKSVPAADPAFFDIIKRDVKAMIEPT